MWKRSLIGLCIAITVFACWSYWRYEPGLHFNRSSKPILTTPEHALLDRVTPHSKSESSTAFQNEDDHIDVEDQFKDSFNLLLIGIDARENESSRADVIMLAHVIPKERKVTLISIPRDTGVYLDHIGFTKINHAHIVGELNGGSYEGTKQTLQAVSNLLHIPIHYYVKTDFRGFEYVIDKIGGIEVDLPESIELSAFHHQVLEKGRQRLDGETALMLARERYSLPDGDFGRQMHQAMIIKAALKQMLSPANLIKLPDLLSIIEEDIVSTNFTNHDLISLAWLYKDMSIDDIQYLQIDGEAEYREDAILNARLFYLIPDEHRLTELTEKYLLH